MGATKEGKSTLICFMKGMKLEVFKNKYGEVRIRKQELSLEMQEPIIGPNITSQTSVPHEEPISEEESLWDTAGKWYYINLLINFMMF